MPSSRPGSIRVVSSVIVALMVMLMPVAGYGYVTLQNYQGSDSHWASNPTFYINYLGSDDVAMSELKSAIEAAFQTWQDVSCSYLSFVNGGTASFDSMSPDGNGIFLSFADGQFNFTTGDAMGVTLPYTKSNGEFTQAVIIFNGVDFQWTTNPTGSMTVMDVQAIAVHEIGHGLGLDHSRFVDAAMFFQGGGGAEERILSNDDKNGLCFVYPNTTFAGGQLCDSCGGANDYATCGSGICLDFYWNEYQSGSRYFCSKSCTADSQCGQGFWCVTDSQYADADFYQRCIPDYTHCDNRGRNIPLGEYCWGMEQCESGACMGSHTTAFCTASCNPATGSGCPSGFQCVDVGSGQGVCVEQGTTAYGGACDNHWDCQSSFCVWIGSEGICTVECSTSANCPSGNPCYQNICIPPGDGVFGELCTSHFDCQSGYCIGWPAGYCSQECVNDAQCPGDATCGPQGHCLKSSASGEGGPCTTADDCKEGMWCRSPYEGATEGVCTLECDPKSDAGCPAGKVCKWHYTAWLNQTKGRCVDAIGGRSQGEPCTGADPCEMDLLCLNLEGQFKCYRDCNEATDQGCAAAETCVDLPDQNPPWPDQGACLAQMAPEPAEDVGIITPDEGPGEDTQIWPDTGPVGPDAGTVEPDTTAVQDTAVDDTAAHTNPPLEVDSNSGGCHTASLGNGPTALPMLIFVGLLLLWVLRSIIGNVYESKPRQATGPRCRLQQRVHPRHRQNRLQP